MKPTVKYKLSRDKYCKKINDMQSHIKKYTNNLWIPKYNIKMNNHKTNSWFTISESIENKKNIFVENKYYTDKLDDVKYKCKKVNLILTQKQKGIINNWLNSYSKLYNIAINYIQSKFSVDDLKKTKRRRKR